MNNRNHYKILALVKDCSSLTQELAIIDANLERAKSLVDKAFGYQKTNKDKT